MNSSYGGICARMHGAGRRSPIHFTGSTTGLQGGFIARWTHPRPRATPLLRRSARAAPSWCSRRAHATDPGCRAQCGRSNDLLLALSNELPSILDSTITIAHLRSTIHSTRRPRVCATDATPAHTHARRATHAHTHPSHAHTCAGFIPTFPTCLARRLSAAADSRTAAGPPFYVLPSRLSDPARWSAA